MFTFFAFFSFFLSLGLYDFDGTNQPQMSMQKFCRLDTLQGVELFRGAKPPILHNLKTTAPRIIIFLTKPFRIPDFLSVHNASSWANSFIFRVITQKQFLPFIVYILVYNFGRVHAPEMRWSEAVH